MQIGIRNPATVSGLLVDADLNMGSTYKIKADHIAEATALHGTVMNNMTLAAAGTTLRQSSDGTSSTTAGSYTLLKTITIPSGYYGSNNVFRIDFELRVVSACTAYGRIYRNAVAVGTERTNGTASFVNYSEDISGWSSGDEIRLYGYNSCFSTSEFRNFRVYSADAGVVGVLVPVW